MLQIGLQIDAFQVHSACVFEFLCLASHSVVCENWCLSSPFCCCAADWCLLVHSVVVLEMVPFKSIACVLQLVPSQVLSAVVLQICTFQIHSAVVLHMDFFQVYSTVVLKEGPFKSSWRVSQASRWIFWRVFKSDHGLEFRGHS